MEIQETLCILCEKPEAKCGCDRYCCLCHGPYQVRLCVDGQYYCPDCREACDVAPASPERD